MPMGLPKDADAVLLFECDGIAEAVEKEIEKIVEITKKYGASDVRVAKDQDDANKILDGTTGRVCGSFRQGPHGPVRRCHRSERKHTCPNPESAKRLSKKYDVEIVRSGSRRGR